MKNKSKLSALTVVAVVMVIWGAGCGARDNNSRSQEGGAASSTGYDYVLKYEWPEKPKVGNYTLKVNLVDRTGAPVEDAQVVVSYDMPSMRGAHATTETMKKNAKGDYLLPIHFAMQGDWEIILSAQKDGNEIAAELILLDI